MVFLTVFWDGTAGVLLCGGIFFHVMVGVGCGVEGPKELMGWVGAVVDGRTYPPPATSDTTTDTASSGNGH